MSESSWSCRSCDHVNDWGENVCARCGTRITDTLLEFFPDCMPVCDQDQIATLRATIEAKNAEIADRDQKIDTLFSALRGEQGILDGETGEILHPCAERDAAEARVKELEDLLNEANKLIMEHCDQADRIAAMERELAEARKDKARLLALIDEAQKDILVRSHSDVQAAIADVGRRLSAAIDEAGGE